MIRDTNKEKRLDWVIENKDLFLEDVIFSGESTIQVETHQRDKSPGTSDRSAGLGRDQPSRTHKSLYI